MSFDHNYNQDFYNYIERGSLASAEIFWPYLSEHVQFDSVVDVGCGRGAWLSVLKKLGFDTVRGLDGDYVERRNLLIDENEFVPFNLSEKLSSDRSFDLSMSLEVAEHLPEDKADIFVDNLVALSDVVLFSAAVVGQGGEHHVNEKPLEYWRGKFEARGYSCYDFIRERMKGETAVMPWYRNNCLLYANERGKSRLSKYALSTVVPSMKPLASYGSLGWKLRILAVRLLPKRVASAIAQLKSYWCARWARTNA